MRLIIETSKGQMGFCMYNLEKHPLSKQKGEVVIVGTLLWNGQLEGVRLKSSSR